MARRNQTDSSDKLYKEKKLKEAVWNLLVFRLNQLAQGSSGPASGFYGRLLASVKAVH